MYEGGIRVPLLIRWPRLAPGETSELVTSQDFAPTLNDLLNRDEPTNVDGLSLLPLIKNPQAKLPKRALFWHFPHYYPRMTPASAIRSDDWKLIHYYEDDRRELYNLRDDPGEQHDLAEQESVVTRSLYQKLESWRVSVGANPPTKQP